MMIAIQAVWDCPEGPRIVTEYIRPCDVRRICPHDGPPARTVVTVAGRGCLFSPEAVAIIAERVNGAIARRIRPHPHFLKGTRAA